MEPVFRFNTALCDTPPGATLLPRSGRARAEAVEPNRDLAYDRSEVARARPRPGPIRRRVRPNIGKHRRTVVEFGPTFVAVRQSWSNSVERCRNLPNCGRAWPATFPTLAVQLEKLVRIFSISSRGPHARARAGARENGCACGPGCLAGLWPGKCARVMRRTGRGFPWQRPRSKWKTAPRREHRGAAQSGRIPPQPPRPARTIAMASCLGLQSAAPMHQ